MGIAIGGYLAGKQANAAALYHGALVGLGWIALETLGVVPTASYTNDLATDTVIVVALDVATLIAGSLGGALARPGPSSSSDTDRGR